MKKLRLISVVIVTYLFFTSISNSADTVQEKTSEGEIQRQGVEEQTNAFLGIQEAYLTKLKRINSDLLTKHTILAGNYYAAKLANTRIKLSMEKGTTIPAYVGEVLEYLSTQRANMDAEIKELEKKKENLRIDVNSLYDGKVTEWLSKELDEEEKEYADSFNQIYDTTSELIEKK